MSKSQLYASRWTLVWGVAMVGVVFVSMHFSDGRLIYTLDDPYIHLAVAETIVTGGYGVNAEEFSSPSSSILYPILLALTEALGLGTLGPLVINTLSAGLSVWLLLEYFWRNAVPEKANGRQIFANMVAPLLILSISAIALPMTGMEHSLHILAVIVTMRGLVVALESGELSIWFVIAIICMPFLRFEGVALATASVLVLILAGQLRSGVLIGAAIVAGFGAYTFMMQYLDLPLLPSSVLVKSNIAAKLQMGETLGFLRSVASNLRNSLSTRWGALLALSVCALLVTAAQDRDGRWRSLKSPELLISGAMICGLCAHLVAGRYGWFHRHEVYTMAILVTGGMYLLRPILLSLNDKRLVAAQLGLVAALSIVVSPHAYAVLKTPLASRNIYEQQFQMHRFATEFFPRRVAVNDLGWVSYNNNTFVLDLWGLGSETVRNLKATRRLDAKAIADLVKKADVDFAMIYGSWFRGAIPKSWCLMAIMQSQKIVSASGEVYFFAVRDPVQTDMRAALDQFAAALPKRVFLKRMSCVRP